MVGAEELAKMKKISFPGQIQAEGLWLTTKALAKALDDGVIAGAPCDVFRHGAPAKRFIRFCIQNTIVTPHLAFYSQESPEKRAETVLTTYMPGSIRADKQDLLIYYLLLKSKYKSAARLAAPFCIQRL